MLWMQSVRVARLAHHAAAHASQVGDNLFVHGGLTAEHLHREGTMPESGEGDKEQVLGAEAAMEKINTSMENWVLRGKNFPESLWGQDSPMWLRTYSSPDSRDIQDAARTELEDVSLESEYVCVSWIGRRIGVRSTVAMLAVILPTTKSCAEFSVMLHSSAAA